MEDSAYKTTNSEYSLNWMSTKKPNPLKEKIPLYSEIVK